MFSRSTLGQVSSFHLSEVHCLMGILLSFQFPEIWAHEYMNMIPSRGLFTWAKLGICINLAGLRTSVAFFQVISKKSIMRVGGTLKTCPKLEELELTWVFHWSNQDEKKPEQYSQHMEVCLENWLTYIKKRKMFPEMVTYEVLSPLRLIKRTNKSNTFWLMSTTQSKMQNLVWISIWSCSLRD